MALLELIVEHSQIVLACVLAVLVVYLILGGGKSGLPPTIKGWPIIGNMLQVEPDMTKYVMKLSKQLGSDIISLKVGSNVMVFLLKQDMIKEAFAGDELTARPDLYFKRVLTQGNGVLASDGSLWKDQRRFALTVLRNFGMGKMKMDENIREELEFVVEDIRKHNGKPYDLEKIINVAVANVMCQTALGQRYEYTNAEFIDLQDRFEENVRAASITSPLHHFKFLQYLPIQTSTEKIIHTNYHHVGAFLKKVVAEHKRTFDGNEIRDFIDAYLAEIARTADKPDSTFTEAQLNWMIYDMFIAGSETTATSLRWGILYMMHFPDIQRKVQAEIDEVIGRERVPTGRDRTSLPYTDAVINEIFRHSSIVSMAIPHTNTERDVTFRGYTIPKNAFVFGNIYAAHRDPALFKRPNDFDPENFLDENGKLTNTQNMIAFCVGKRACLGEGLARMEMFLFFTRLLQLFNFENPKNEALPPLDRTHGMIAKPFYHYKVCATSR